MSEEIDSPLATAQAFSEGYNRSAGFFHGTEIHSQLNSFRNVYDGTQQVIDKTLSEGLRTMSGFAVFRAEGDTEPKGGFLLVKKVFEEVPLEYRDVFMGIERNHPAIANISTALLVGSGIHIDHIEKAQNAIRQNDPGYQKIAIIIASLLLPDPRRANQILSADDRVGDFFSHPRKERRKLIKEERKSQ